jgi:hypothetical protein
MELKTPFINDFKLAMDKVTADLVKEFNAATGYNHSDEISLVFKSLNEDTDDELIKELFVIANLDNSGSNNISNSSLSVQGSSFHALRNEI